MADKSVEQIDVIETVQHGGTPRREHPASPLLKRLAQVAPESIQAETLWNRSARMALKHLATRAHA